MIINRGHHVRKRFEKGNEFGKEEQKIEECWHETRQCNSRKVRRWKLGFNSSPEVAERRAVAIDI